MRPVSIRLPRMELQWGHGFSAVEIDVKSGDVETVRLQWGHGLSAVEMHRPGHLCTASEHGFNGATAFQPWKCACRLLGCVAVSRTRFNGATAFQPWKYRSRPAVADAMDYGFNGATAFQPWKLHALSDQSFARPDQLQWGHGLSAVEMSMMRGSVQSSHAGFNGATAFQPWK